MWTTRDHLPNRRLEDAAFALRVAVHEATLFSAHREPCRRLRRAAQVLVSGLRSSSSGPSGSETGAISATELERRILALARDLQVAVPLRLHLDTQAVGDAVVVVAQGRNLDHCQTSG